MHYGWPPVTQEPAGGRKLLGGGMVSQGQAQPNPRSLDEGQCRAHLFPGNRLKEGGREETPETGDQQCEIGWEMPSFSMKNAP